MPCPDIISEKDEKLRGSGGARDLNIVLKGERRIIMSVCVFFSRGGEDEVVPEWWFGDVEISSV